MAHYTSTIRGPNHVVSNSYVQSIKPSKNMDIHDNRTCDHSIFIGYGPNSKRIKDRWEATKKQLRFENNYVALKWLLDSFVDDYLRSKNMEDTAMLTRDTVSIKKEPKERRVDEVSSNQSRRPASHSPSKARFEDVVTQNGISDKQSHSSAYESRQHISAMKDHVKRSEASRSTGDLHIAGQYGPYKYVTAAPEYWSSPYYHQWPMNSRMVNMGPIQGYQGYMIKTPSCSSLPTPDSHKLPGGLRQSESLKLLSSKKDDRDESSVSEKRPTVNLGFKTKSMPNLQFIPKESEVNSDDEEELIESDPESQGDLLALSSLSMPNLRKIPSDRIPLMSPPSRGHYEPASLLRDRHDVCAASSYSMPNLKAIQGMQRSDEHDDRKKTIRDFVMKRLETSTNPQQGDQRTKIFNPNGYYPQSAMRDSERKLVIRERLLNRMAKREREETSRGETPSSHHNGKMLQVTSHLKFASKKLPIVSESRLWPDKGYMTAPAGTLGKDDHANNNWKVPQAVGTSEQQLSPRNVWNRSPVKKVHTTTGGIWNPADVHVKIENSSPQDDVTPQVSMTSPTSRPEEERVPSRPSSSNNASSVADAAKGDSSSKRKAEDDEMSAEEEVDVENLKDDEIEDEESEESRESDSDQDDDASEDEKKSKRTRKTDKPRKRLKAM